MTRLVSSPHNRHYLQCISALDLHHWSPPVSGAPRGEHLIMSILMHQWNSQKKDGAPHTSTFQTTQIGDRQSKYGWTD